MNPQKDKGFDVLQQRATSWNSPLISVPDRGPFDRKVLSRMLQLCKKYQVKIWHGHDYKSNLVGLLLRPFYKMKLVTTVHGWVKHTFKTPLYYAVDRWTLPWYHHVICVSEDLHERALKLSVSPENCTLIHNAIDETMFARQHAPAEAALRKQMNTPADRLVIGAVGRLSAEKGFNLLIQAAARLIGEGHNIELWIAGDGDAKPDLEKLIAQLGVGDRVKLLGFVSDTIGLYHAMDLFCLSSLREGLPNVVLEAMSMGVPVVSTKVAGVPKMITEGENGLLVEIGNVDLLTDAVRSAVRDAGLRQHLSLHGRALIEKEYSFTRRMAKVKGIYDRVLGIEEHAPRGTQETTGPKAPGTLEAAKA